ncbi:putative mitochondrial protein [Vitis vinifera]|uniref:Putative mitochondrial protein n=1 Tax=Vitis vinifera TaxID=29760 RepID=A0A438J6R3_VITVI|nr:putative mitochondrial protein [Vitis vinifera]
MGLQNGNRDIFLKLLVPCCLPLTCPHNFGGESVSETRPPLTLDYLYVAMFESTPCLISTPSPNIEGHLNSREIRKYRQIGKHSSTQEAKIEMTYPLLLGNNLVHIPKNIQEALEIPDWREAMVEEIRALEKNGTWEVMTLPRGKKPVGCKWVFTVKYKADGTVERYKARLVAEGFTQTYGIDYTKHLHQWQAKHYTRSLILSSKPRLGTPSV